MGFYGNYYKIKTGPGLVPVEQGQQTTISFTDEVAKTLGVGQEGEEVTPLDDRLKIIETEVGLLNPDGSYGDTAATRIDTLEGFKDREEGFATSAQGAKADSAVQGVKINGTNLEANENKAVDITITDGANNGTISVNGTDIKVTGLASAAFKNETDFEVAGKAQELINSLGTMATESADDYTLQTDFQALKAEIMGTSTNADYEDSRIDKLEAEILGTPNSKNYENSRIDNLESDIKTIQNAGYQTAKDVSTAIKDKADKADTLGGYGIGDAYTKTYIDNNFISISKFGLLEQEVLGENNGYAQSRIDTLETTVSNNITSINNLDQDMNDLITKVDKIKNGIFQGKLSSQEQYNDLLDEDKEYNYRDYWLIYEIPQNADNTDGSIIIYNNVIVYNGDIIEYIGLDDNSNKIFVKQNISLNLINGTGLYSIQALAATENTATGEGSVAFGSNNKNYAKHALVSGNSNTLASSAKNSLVFGSNNYVVFPNALIGGYYADLSRIVNDPDKPNILFALGNGADKNNRKNAFLVDASGNTEVGGKLNVKSSIEVNGNLIVYKTDDQGFTTNYNILENITALQTNKANNATTLEGYGINNAYTKDEVDDEISTIKDLIKSENETLPSSDINTVYGYINLLNNSVSSLTTTINNIPQWKIYNTNLDGTWTGNDTDGYIYSKNFVLDGITLSSDAELNKYIVLFDIGNNASILQRKNLIQCSITAKVVLNEGKAALQLIALQNPNQDNGNILQDCPITYSYIIGEV